MVQFGIWAYLSILNLTVAAFMPSAPHSMVQSPSTGSVDSKSSLKKTIKNKIRVKLLHAGLETCFGWDPEHQTCLDPIAKHISNPDLAPKKRGGDGKLCD